MCESSECPKCGDENSFTYEVWQSLHDTDGQITIERGTCSKCGHKDDGTPKELNSKESE